MTNVVTDTQLNVNKFKKALDKMDTDKMYFTKSAVKSLLSMFTDLDNRLKAIEQTPKDKVKPTTKKKK